MLFLLQSVHYLFTYSNNSFLYRVSPAFWLGLHVSELTRKIESTENICFRAQIELVHV